jgi:hypothetical protein
MLVAGYARRARAAVARDDIEIALRWMRPGILDIGRRRHRVAPDEGGFIDVNAVECEFRADAGIEHVLHLGVLGERRSGRGDAAD